MLGHEVTLAYCGGLGQESFCRKILDCWTGVVDVEDFLKQKYSEDQITRGFAPPASKIVSLMDLIERARNRTS